MSEFDRGPPSNQSCTVWVDEKISNFPGPPSPLASDASSGQNRQGGVGVESEKWQTQHSQMLGVGVSRLGVLCE